MTVGPSCPWRCCGSVSVYVRAYVRVEKGGIFIVGVIWGAKRRKRMLGDSESYSLFGMLVNVAGLLLLLVVVDHGGDVVVVGGGVWCRWSLLLCVALRLERSQ